MLFERFGLATGTGPGAADAGPSGSVSRGAGDCAKAGDKFAVSHNRATLAIHPGLRPRWLLAAVAVIPCSFQRGAGRMARERWDACAPRSRIDWFTPYRQLILTLLEHFAANPKNPAKIARFIQPDQESSRFFLKRR
jgi:hypothetical protein